MADIIPFPTRRIPSPATEQSGETPLYHAREGSLGSPLAGNASRLEQMMDEIAELYEDSSLADCTYCRFNLREEDDAETIESDLASLTELVVFSPEVQREGFRKLKPEEIPSDAVRWGDVFIKCGDVYPFLFTLYTEDYVKHQLASYGEKIVPSPKDIILRGHELSPADIIRAVIKWVNLYCPQQSGRPIRLESDAVLQDLVCDPGIEVVVADPS